MRFHMLNVHQRRLHLAWKQVDAPDDEHVVRASMDLAMSGHCPPTRAGSLRECCQVSSSKPPHRQSLFGEGGKHKLTFFALGTASPVSGSITSTMKWSSATWSPAFISHSPDRPGPITSESP